MPETPSLVDRFLRSDAVMYAGPSETTRDYADKMLLAALQEAQTVARSYDNKAQIVGVGYILALNLVLRFGDLLPTHAPIGPLFYAVVWGIVIMPILQFGQVLYPSRTRAEREFNGKTSHGSKVPPVYYVDPSYFADVRDLMHQVLRSDWTSVLATELLKTSRVRIIKQARFQRGLMMTVVSFIVLGGEQFFRSFTLDLNETTSYEAGKRSSRPHLLFRHRKGGLRLGKDQLLRQAGARPEISESRITMDPATITAVSALAGSAIGALASVATSWLTQHRQNRMQRLEQEASRRERLFGEFIDQASRAYADGIVQERLDDPAKLVPMYTAISKLRLFAMPGTIGAAEAVLEHVVTTYETTSSALEARNSRVAAHDILRAFAEACRAELTSVR